MRVWEFLCTTYIFLSSHDQKSHQKFKGHRSSPIFGRPYIGCITFFLYEKTRFRIQFKREESNSVRAHWLTSNVFCNVGYTVGYYLLHTYLLLCIRWFLSILCIELHSIEEKKDESFHSPESLLKINLGFRICMLLVFLKNNNKFDWEVNIFSSGWIYRFFHITSC